MHAIALRALLNEAPSVLSSAERQLQRLARSTGDGKESSCPAAAKPPGSPADAQRPSLEVVERLGVCVGVDR